MTDAADLVMPKLGLTMTEGRVAQWLVKPGAQFAQGDVVVVIETDKIANDVEAPAPGRLIEIIAEEGSVVPVGAPIAKWSLEGAQPQSQATARVGDTRGDETVPVPASETAPPVRSEPRDGTRIVATPLARRMAREAELDLAGLTGTGPNGRIKAADVEQALALRSTAGAVQHVPASVPLPCLERAPEVSVKRLSFATIVVDVDALLAIQARLAKSGNGAFQLRDYVALACIRAFEPDHSSVRLGIEVPDGRGPAGLVAGQRETLSSLACKCASLEQSPGGGEESGGDVVVLATDAPLHIFAPAAPAGWRMALGVGSVRRVRRAPDAALHELSLALSYDATTLDHVSAARFLGRVKALLEEPLQLLAS